MIVVPTSPLIHPLFDLLGWGAGAATGMAIWRWRLKPVAQTLAARTDAAYFAALAAGAIGGAWLAGSLNTLRQAAPTLSHSIVGALAGAIVGVEAYKAVRGLRGSTGGLFVGSLAAGVVVGR